MQPLSDEPDDFESSPDENLPEQEDPREAGAGRRAIFALTAYAVLAVVAGIRLDGKPRLVVWLFLGLFAVKTLLLVLKQRAS